MRERGEREDHKYEKANDESNITYIGIKMEQQKSKLFHNIKI